MLRACVREPESIHRRACPVQDESASGLAATRRRPLCPTPPRCRLPSSAPEPPGVALANCERGSRFLQCRRGPAGGMRLAEISPRVREPRTDWFPLRNEFDKQNSGTRFFKLLRSCTCSVCVWKKSTWRVRAPVLFRVLLDAAAASDLNCIKNKMRTARQTCFWRWLHHLLGRASATKQESRARVCAQGVEKIELFIFCNFFSVCLL